MRYPHDSALHAGLLEAELELYAHSVVVAAYSFVQPDSVNRFFERKWRISDRAFINRAVYHSKLPSSKLGR